MKWQYIVVYIVFAMLLSLVFELIDRIIKAIGKKLKARKITEAEKPVDDEEV